VTVTYNVSVEMYQRENFENWLTFD